VPSPSARPDDPAVLLTTSGSSGTPKTVVHAQRSLAHKARQLSVLHGTTPDDAVLVPAPLSHMAGVLHAVMHPVGTGVKAVLMAKWDPEEALELVQRERVTMLFGPPIFALGIASATGFSSEAARSVRLVSSGATAISEAYVHRVEELFGAHVKRTYGSTEAPIACTTLPGDDPARGWTTDGRPVPGVELELRDPDDGTVLSDGGPGEIWLRGPELCDGYLDAEQTARTFVDGWMRTRDLGHLDDEGFLTVVGRVSDFIIRGGMNISAREVEDALERHPAVAQAVVLGFADDVYGERVAAFVVSDTAIDRDDCVEWFREIGVAKYKVPDRVVRLDEMPVLSTYQKPDVNALRALL
jgi:acyl-CoA synthetase (AMP-forming)/AMP-acid ligase II